MMKMDVLVPLGPNSALDTTDPARPGTPRDASTMERGQGGEEVRRDGRGFGAWQGERLIGVVSETPKAFWSEV